MSSTSPKKKKPRKNNNIAVTPESNVGVKPSDTFYIYYTGVATGDMVAYALDHNNRPAYVAPIVKRIGEKLQNPQESDDDVLVNACLLKCDPKDPIQVLENEKTNTKHTHVFMRTIEPEFHDTKNTESERKAWAGQLKEFFNSIAEDKYIYKKVFVVREDLTPKNGPWPPLSDFLTIPDIMGMAWKMYNEKPEEILSQKDLCDDLFGKHVDTAKVYYNVSQSGSPDKMESTSGDQSQSSEPPSYEFVAETTIEETDTSDSKKRGLKSEEGDSKQKARRNTRKP